MIAAELRKAVSLPAIWVGVAVVFLGSIGLTVLNAMQVRQAISAGRTGDVAFTSPFEVAYAMMPLGTVGAVVIGVVLISSEYTANSTDAGGGRQITTTLAATPHRSRLLIAKAITLLLAVAALAVVTLPAAVGLSHVIIEVPETVGLAEAVGRWLGGTVYWMLSGLMAVAVAVVLRSGIVPLIVLIVNSSVVSVSLLLSKLTPLAQWLPDLAGRRLFGGVPTIDGGLDAVPGALVMTAWAAALFAIAAYVFSRRDA